MTALASTTKTQGHKNTRIYPRVFVSLCLCVLVVSFAAACSLRSPGQPPYAPGKALDKFRIDERFKIELYASEPLLDGPVAMAFDAQGRTFVFESPGFPLKPTDGAHIKLLEDTNGDGRPDRSTPFPSGSELPAGVANWRESRDRTMDAEGRWFVTRPDSHVVYQASGQESRAVSDHGESAIIFPITENPVYPVLTEADRTTSTCAIAFYANPAVAEFARALFTAEPVHNLVHCDLLSVEGSIIAARRAREQAEFLASADAWFHPVSFAIAPDKALLVVDYYAPLAGPAEVLEVGIKSGEYQFKSSGRGRIYRITPRPGMPHGSATGAVAAKHPIEPERESPALNLPSDAAALEKLIADPMVAEDAQAAAVRRLGDIPGEAAAAFLLSKWRAMTSTPRREAMEALFKEPVRLNLLLDQLEREQIPLWCLDDEHRVRLLAGKDRPLAERTRRMLEARDPGRHEAVKKYESALAKVGNKETGEIVYRRLCGRCHTFRGGSNYGPDLWTVSSRPPRRILIDILLPSRAMAPGRELYMIDLKGGGSVDGVIGSQTPTALNILHDESRQEAVLRQDIRRILMSDFSAMPVDLASQISVQDMADLLRFLTSR